MHLLLKHPVYRFPRLFLNLPREELVLNVRVHFYKDSLEKPVKVGSLTATEGWSHLARRRGADVAPPTPSVPSRAPFPIGAAAAGRYPAGGSPTAPAATGGVPVKQQDF